MGLGQRLVSELMEREVAALTQDETLDLAEDVMRLGRVRHMPVLDGAQVVGVVSQRDLLAASLSKALSFDHRERRNFLRSIEVKEVMSREVQTIAPGASLREAAERMIHHRIGCLPVVENERFVGLITETDLMRAALVEPEAGEEAHTGSGRVEPELDELRRLRDELRVQVELGKAEARELWEELERRWIEVDAKLQVAARRAEEPLEIVGETARRLVDEIRDGYRRIRSLM